MKNENKRRRRFLNRVEKVLTEYKKHARPETTITGVWREHIEEEFLISLTTLRQYLEINVKQEMDKLDKLDKLEK